ncbi:MAG: LysM peptidoglycan-binding domain-containing protein [Lentisphaeria bacterium]|nr:LysM peptidoglycan-binding domain-containing protein [Lentisphaeria bacterium]
MKKTVFFVLFIFSMVLFFCGCSETGSNHPMLKKAGQSMRMGEYRNAEICYKKYLAKHPDSASVHQSLASLYDEHLEEYLLAIYHYKEFLRLQSDANAETIRNTESFIKRCEQRYMQKGGTVKKVELTDEQEIERMTADYKKNLAEQQKNSGNDRETQTAEKQIADSPVIEKVPEKTAEIKNKVQLSETLIADTGHIAEKNDPAAAAAEDKVKKVSAAVPAAPPENKKAAAKETVKPPPMQTGKVEKTPEKVEKIQEYKVKRGDTFSHLSRKFYGTVRYHRKLMEYNKIPSPNALRVGKTLKIPPIDVLKGEKL